MGWTIAELHERYRTGRTTPAEVVAEHLRRIAARDPALHAFVSVPADTARAEAARPPAGPLHGVPVAVKELIDVAGAEVGFGSPAFAGRIAAADATVVRRLRAAGAIIVGVTRSPEFGWSLSGRDEAAVVPVTNPWDPDRDPGGSSSGSAVAVAAGLAVAALGTDTSGSLRLPPACCGVWGFKPGRATVDRTGVRLLTRSFDEVGPIARTAADLIAVYRVIRDPGPRPAPAPPRTLLLSVPADLHPDYREALAATARRAAALGWTVQETALPSAEAVWDDYLTVLFREAAELEAAQAGPGGPRRDRYTAPVRAYLALGDRVAAAEYRRARRRLRAYAAGLRDRLRPGVLLLSPVVSGPGRPGPAGAEGAVDTAAGPRPLTAAVAPHTLPQSICGLPAVAMPVGRDRAGMPIGLQLSGAPGQDEAVLAAAALLGVPAGEPDAAPAAPA